MDHDAPDERLTPAQRKAARALVFSPATLDEVASSCSVSRSTLLRWRLTEDFRAHVAELQAERDEQALRESAGLMADAAGVVRAGLDRMAKMLAHPDSDLPPRDVAGLVQAAHAVLKTTSAQVGPVERHAVEATVRTLSDEVAAARLIAAGELAPDDED